MLSKIGAGHRRRLGCSNVTAWSGDVRTPSQVALDEMRWMRDWLMGLSEKSDPGVWGGLLCRKRYIDEKVESSRNEIEAVVSLGAGFDTRSFRLPTLSGLRRAWPLLSSFETSRFAAS